MTAGHEQEMKEPCFTFSVTIVVSPFQVYAVVDEMFLAGEIRETSQQKVLNQLQYLNTLD